MKFGTIIIYGLIYLSIFCLVEFLSRRFKIEAEKTRKFIHIFSGIVALSFPFFLEKMSEVILLTGVFFLILMAIKKWNIFPSITNVERKTYGSIFFPITVLLCFVAYHYTENYLAYFLPLLVLSLSDPLASIVGRRWGRRPIPIRGNKKSFEGSLAFFISAFIFSMISIWAFSSFSLIVLLTLSAFIGLSSALVELISVSGWDNITIPVSIIIVLSFILPLL